MKNNSGKYQYESFFDVPENYFEELPQKIMNRVTVKNNVFSPGSIKLAYIIAVPCLIILISWYYFRGIDNEKENLNWEQISNVEIIEYMEFENISASEILNNIQSEEELENLLLDFSIEEEFAIQQENLNSAEWIELSDYDFTPL